MQSTRSAHAAKSGSAARESALQGTVPISEIRPCPTQPRIHYDDTSLEVLTRSIKARGVIEPLIVRPTGNHYELVCGERRFRAAQAAGLTEVPVRTMALTDEEAFVMALHENIHRDNLTVLDEARAFKRLLQSGAVKSQRQLAEMLRVSQTRISQRIALLAMPAEVIDELEQVPAVARLTERHARAIRKLAGAAAQVTLARMVVEKELSVADTERLVRDSTGGDAPREPSDGWVELEELRFRPVIGGLEVQVKSTVALAQADALERLARHIRGQR